MAVDSVEQPQNGEKESAAAAAAATAAPPATAPAAPPPTVPTEPQKEPGSAEGDKAQPPEVSGGANMGGGLEAAASAGPAPAAATQVVALVGEVCPLFVAAHGYASAAFAIEFQLPCTGFAGGLTPLSTGL